MRTVDIYIDTSIKGPRRRDGECLYILAFRAQNGATADMGRRIRREETTENQLALLGLEAALRHLREPCRLILHQIDIFRPHAHHQLLVLFPF